MDDQRIEHLKNLGPVSASWLREIGVRTRGDLVRLGPVTAYLLVKTRQSKASLNLLYALQAALDGVHWTELSAETKQRLREEAEA